MKTYADIRGEETAGIERFGKEGLDAVEDEQNAACDEAVAGFQPLAVGFVRVSRVISVVASCMSVGRGLVVLGFV